MSEVSLSREQEQLLLAIRLWLQNQKAKAQNNQQNKTGDI